MLLCSSIPRQLSAFGTVDIQQWMHGVNALVVTAEDAYCRTGFLHDPFAMIWKSSSSSRGSSSSSSRRAAHNRRHIHLDFHTHGLACMAYEIDILGIGLRHTITELVHANPACLTLLEIVSPESIGFAANVALALELLRLVRVRVRCVPC